MGYYQRDPRTGKRVYVPGVKERISEVMSDLTDYTVLKPAGFLVDVCGDIVAIVFKWLFILFVVVIIGAFLLLIGKSALMSLGILKSEWSTVLDSPVSVEASAVLIPHDNDPEISVSVYENSEAVFKSSNKNHSLFVSCDGMLYDYGSYLIPMSLEPSSKPHCSLELSRAYLLTFTAKKADEVLQPDTFSVTSAGEEIGWTDVGNGKYAVILPDNAGEMELTIAVPGYETVTVNQDWESCRFGVLEVQLNVQ